MTDPKQDAAPDLRRRILAPESLCDAVGALTRIAAMPCITSLLGDDLGHDCGCASCDAKATLTRIASHLGVEP